MSIEKPILFLTSALLDDRKLLYSELLSSLKKACIRANVWATSYHVPSYRTLWAQVPAEVEPFPFVRPFKEFPYNYLRRLNELVWDYRLASPSKLSVRRHFQDRQEKLPARLLRGPARALAGLGLEQPLERGIERVLVRRPRSPEGRARLESCRPALVIATGPNRFEEPAIVAAARALRIPTLAAIHSWDNLTTKSRMVFRYDGYLVWSDQMRQELHLHYPESRAVPVFVVGAL